LLLNDTEKAKKRKNVDKTMQHYFQMCQKTGLVFSFWSRFINLFFNTLVIAAVVRHGIQCSARKPTLHTKWSGSSETFHAVSSPRVINSNNPK